MVNRTTCAVVALIGFGVMADSVRPADAAIAGHNPPIVSGAMQETYYAHSGEMATHAVDLDAGGRNGVDVTIGRCYYSRTLGATALGFGWDATMFRRLRPLPDCPAQKEFPPLRNYEKRSAEATSDVLIRLKSWQTRRKKCHGGREGGERSKFRRLQRWRFV